MDNSPGNDSRCNYAVFYSSCLQQELYCVYTNTSYGEHMITDESIRLIHDGMTSLNPDEIRSLAIQMSNEQPTLQAYLIAMSKASSFDEEEKHLFFFIGAVLWQVVRQHVQGWRMVTDADLEAAEDDNERMLEQLATESDGDLWSVGESLVANYPEPELLRYMVRSLMEDEEGLPDNPPFEQENIGFAFFHLKVVMDALLQARLSLHKP